MTTIFNLNQDCWDEIFKYFSIYELIDIESTCKHFKFTCELAYKSKRFRAFKIQLRYAKTEYFEAIFERIANNITSFEFSGGYIMDEKVKQTVIEAISTDFVDLKKLSLNYIQFTNEQFVELKKCFTHLTHLDLSHCNITERNLGTLNGEEFKNITSLKLAGNALMSGAFFNSMNHIQILDVSYCFELRYYMFQKFLNNCIRLVELDITGSPQVIPEDKDILEEIFKFQPCVEKLVMDNVGIERNDEVLAKFKHLKYSSITGRKFGL